ncbi:hypothetical protein NQ314_016209 [Rhamnusium bicolor]|uniref:FAD-binding FR-type domain-containing protein n=1 Tax=Rhamnusium bicolor TaxID=1586634 RepID=A0AAV8WXI1_9CUCU|nr:hypothetical protein NQ314_016209 [Rhamnusium bicolor]
MEPPTKPDESDCCNSGCNPCILDVYEEQLKKYKHACLNPPKTYSNCISQTSYSIFKVVNIERQSEVAFLYTFEYLRPLKGERSEDNLKLCYEPGQHFLMKAKVYSEEFTRAYTPIPRENDIKKFTTLIKLYEHGKMSNYLRRIRIGKETLWRGPYGEYEINYNQKYLFFISTRDWYRPNL